MLATGRFTALKTVCHAFERPTMRLVKFPTASYWKMLLLAALVSAMSSTG